MLCYVDKPRPLTNQEAITNERLLFCTMLEKIDARQSNTRVTYELVFLAPLDALLGEDRDFLAAAALDLLPLPKSASPAAVSPTGGLNVGSGW